MSNKHKPEIAADISDKTSKKALLYGFYGRGNVGDDLLMETISAQLREWKYDVTVVTSFDTEQPAPGFEVIRAPVMGPSLHADLMRVTLAIKKSDFVVLGGGGIFQDTHSDYTLHTVGTIVLLAKLLGKPVLSIGNGIGPFRTGKSKQWSDILMSHLDHIFVRDQYSYELIPEKEQSRADVIVDPVWWFVPNGQESCSMTESDETRAPVVGVTMREWPEVALEEVHDALGLLWKKLSARIVLVPFAFSSREPRDMEYLKRIAMGAMKKHKGLDVCVAPMTDYPNAQEICKTISQCDVFLSMRFHGIILSTIVGVPVGGLACSPKITSVMHEAGFGGNVVEAKGIDSRSIFDLAAKLLEDLRENISKQIFWRDESFIKVQSDRLQIVQKIEECCDRGARRSKRPVLSDLGVSLLGLNTGFAPEIYRKIAGQWSAASRCIRRN